MIGIRLFGKFEDIQLKCNVRVSLVRTQTLVTCVSGNVCLWYVCLGNNSNSLVMFPGQQMCFPGNIKRETCHFTSSKVLYC